MEKENDLVYYTAERLKAHSDELLADFTELLSKEAS